MINTVTGKIEPRQLGITMCHEHLSIDLSRVRGDDDSTFDDYETVLSELRMAAGLGVGAVVEVSTIDIRQDIRAIKRFSVDTGMHIIASTGFYLEPYHPAMLAQKSEEDIAAIFVKELIEGIDGTDIRTGIIAEIATSRDRIAPNERKVFHAAAIAAKQTGAAISTHCDLGTMALGQAEILLSMEVPAGKIVLGHMDLRDDMDYHLQLLDMGVNLAMDTIGKTAYLSDERRADLAAALIGRGYEKQLVLSQDVSRKSYFVKNGGKGYTAVMDSFLPLLRQRGVAQSAIDAMLIENPARILDMG